MLVTTIRGQAESHPDSDVQKRLLAAAKALADATAKLVEAAKVRKKLHLCTIPSILTLSMLGNFSCFFGVC